MHIKSVAIKSFLSYEKFTMDQMALGKGVNLILGKNGSGKSSFLHGKFKDLILTYNSFSNYFLFERRLQCQNEVREEKVPS